MKEIEIFSRVHGKRLAIVDNDSYYKLSHFNWHLIAKKNKHGIALYAARSVILETGVEKRILMHREVMNETDSKVLVDHRNHNGLDNRKDNLRCCTYSQSLANRRPYGNISKYKGVTKSNGKNSNGKWTAFTGVNSKIECLGTFKNEEDAAKAYDKKAFELHGEFAYLNFPEELRRKNGIAFRFRKWLSSLLSPRE